MVRSTHVKTPTDATPACEKAKLPPDLIADTCQISEQRDWCYNKAAHLVLEQLSALYACIGWLAEVMGSQKLNILGVSVMVTCAD